MFFQSLGLVSLYFFLIFYVFEISLICLPRLIQYHKKYSKENNIVKYYNFFIYQSLYISIYLKFIYLFQIFIYLFI